MADKHTPGPWNEFARSSNDYDAYRADRSWIMRYICRDAVAANTGKDAPTPA